MSPQHPLVPVSGMAAAAAAVGGLFLGLRALNRLLSPGPPSPAGAPPRPPAFGRGFPD